MSSLQIVRCTCGVYFSSRGLTRHQHQCKAFAGTASRLPARVRSASARPGSVRPGSERWVPVRSAARLDLGAGSAPHQPAPAAMPPTGHPVAPPPEDDLDAPQLPSLPALATHSRLWRYLPSDVWPRFRDLCRPSLLADLRSSLDGDAYPRAQALVRFLRIPQLALVRS